MKKKIYLYILIFISLLSVIFADSNGIWNFAEDLRGGIIGGDEQLNNLGYTFINSVYMNDTFKVNGYNVATLDSAGTVPLNQLPFNKGDLVSPANRPFIQGVANYETHYFDLTNLGLSGNIANNVMEGVSFGPNNQIQGGFSKDNICSTAGGNANCGGTTTDFSPGTFYVKIGSDSVVNTNYCNKVDVASNGIITSTIMKSAGICKGISTCDSSSQSVFNYPSGTACASDSVCMDGSCISTLITGYSCYAKYGCQTPKLNICSRITDLKVGDKFTITTSVQYSDWVAAPNMYIRSYTFTYGTPKTDTLLTDYKKRNGNQRIYDGSCLIYGKSWYEGKSSDYKMARIELTKLQKS